MTEASPCIRVQLPWHLRNLAGLPAAEVLVEHPASPAASITSVLDALEALYPMLQGTIRDHITRERRPFLRFFACETDLSHNPPGDPLPAEILAGQEPLIVLGAIAGG